MSLEYEPSSEPLHICAEHSFSNGRFHDPLSLPGEADVTAHVDFAALSLAILDSADPMRGLVQPPAGLASPEGPAGNSDGPAGTAGNSDAPAGTAETKGKWGHSTATLENSGEGGAPVEGAYDRDSPAAVGVASGGVQVAKPEARNPIPESRNQSDTRIPKPETFVNPQPRSLESTP